MLRILALSDKKASGSQPYRRPLIKVRADRILIRVLISFVSQSDEIVANANLVESIRGPTETRAARPLLEKGNCFSIEFLDTTGSMLGVCLHAGADIINLDNTLSLKGLNCFWCGRGDSIYY